MSTSNIIQNQAVHGNIAPEEVTKLSEVESCPPSTTHQLLLEKSVAILWAALKLAEGGLRESLRLLEEGATAENLGVVVEAQKEMASQLEELRYAMKVDFKHAGAEKLLKMRMNADY
ncbi:hypothetical protein MMC18_001924 [Xylographa bjoerkii]|nr:hypothetical protein [Xylographa bjoerkii]